jgi:enoyl-CoA hydratase
VTDARSTATPPKASPEAPPDARLIRVAFPAPLPAGRSAGAEIPGPSAAHVALVTLDRSAQLNALSFAMLRQLAAALEALDSEPACRCIVLTGAGERAFAAGADINELAGQTPASLAAGDDFAAWERIGRIRTPIIAAVRGHALGGGCELAMACDMIVAGDDAQFGQPEIKIGVMPGAGGSQRLTRALG